MRKKCVIYDEDQEYGLRLLNYLKNSKNIPYEIMIFTQLEPLMEYLNENEAGVILLNDEELVKSLVVQNEKKVILLSEEQQGDSPKDYKAIFKYQAGNIIARELINYGEGNSAVGKLSVHVKNNSKIIGIYSPVGRTYKTTFAFAICQILGKDNRVLYINLEEYSGLRQSVLPGDGEGISEVMYWFRQNQANLLGRINEITKPLGNFYYIPPVECPDDVVDVITEEWINLMEFIESKCSYDYIVADIGNAVRKPWEIFKIADRIYMPDIKENPGREKIKEFMEIMRDMGRGKLLENVIGLEIPHDKELEMGLTDVERLQWTVMGKYARKVLDE